MKTFTRWLEENDDEAQEVRRLDLMGDKLLAWRNSDNETEVEVALNTLQNGRDTCRAKHHRHDEVESQRCRDYWALHTLVGDYPQFYKKLFGSEQLPILQRYN